MQHFNDRLLLAVAHVAGKFGLVAVLLDGILRRIVPHATAMASNCPAECYTECSGVCGTGYSQYAFQYCSYDYTGCSRGETWSNFLGCAC